MTPADITIIQQSIGGAGYQQVQATVQFQDNSVSIDPGLAIGSLIATGLSTAFPIQTGVMACTNGGTLTMNLVGATPSSIAGIYNTNVPGIGFKLSYIRASGTVSDFPFPIQAAVGTNGPQEVVYNYFGAGAQFRIQLFKTGDIASNVNVQFGLVGSGQTDGDGKTVLSINGSGINVKVLPSCSVNSSTLNIDFGLFGPTDVSTTSGPTQPVQFTVLCSGPTPPASITAALAGTPDPNDASMLKNTGATNLAIRLKDVSTGTILRPDDPASTLVHTPNGGMQSPFSLEATVLRVGSATPTAGKIQATATLTMTIL
ncbi:fimbrial protein [Paraburkholderia susongensis]|uniref:fimbrial protein n=1 Tax=Paraburkholderia susongensis TaxID=1515439 RepID=UPI001FC91D6B|nr:fimbrial protein [Paraburkholderia susongensis]